MMKGTTTTIALALFAALTVTACGSGSSDSGTLGGLGGRPNPPSDDQNGNVDAGDSFGDGFGDDSGDSFGDDSGDSFGDGSGDSFGDDSGDSFGDDSGDSFGDGSGDSFGDDSGDSFGDDSGDSFGDDSGDSFGDDSGGGFGDGFGDDSGSGGGSGGLAAIAGLYDASYDSVDGRDETYVELTADGRYLEYDYIGDEAAPAQYGINLNCFVYIQLRITAVGGNSYEIEDPSDGSVAEITAVRTGNVLSVRGDVEGDLPLVTNIDTADFNECRP